MKLPRLLLGRKDTGLRHHPEDQSGITGREQKYKNKKTKRVGVRIVFPHSPKRRLPESQQWSPDGAAKAGLIFLLFVQTGG